MRYSPTVTVFCGWLRAVSFLYLQITVSLSTLIRVLLYFEVFITFYFILVFYYRVTFFKMKVNICSIYILLLNRNV